MKTDSAYGWGRKQAENQPPRPGPVDKDGHAFLSNKLNINRQAVSGWGKVVPLTRAIQLQIISDGAIAVDPSCYPAVFSELPNYSPNARLLILFMPLEENDVHSESCPRSQDGVCSGTDLPKQQKT